jgi:hypothetical protein
MAGMATMAAIVLAFVMMWAGISKAVRQDSTADTFAALDLPEPTRLALAVPVVEVGTATLLIMMPQVGAVLSLVLLVGFTVVIVRAVLNGATAGCGCFGGAGEDPVGPPDVLRNGMLAALASLALGTSRMVVPSLGEAAVIVLYVAVGVAVLAWLHRLAQGRSARTPNGRRRSGGRGVPGAGR